MKSISYAILGNNKFYTNMKSSYINDSVKLCWNNVKKKQYNFKYLFNGTKINSLLLQ